MQRRLSTEARAGLVSDRNCLRQANAIGLGRVALPRSRQPRGSMQCRRTLAASSEPKVRQGVSNMLLVARSSTIRRAAITSAPAPVEIPATIHTFVLRRCPKSRYENERQWKSSLRRICPLIECIILVPIHSSELTNKREKEVTMETSPLAGKPSEPSTLVNVPRLVNGVFHRQTGPDSPIAASYVRNLGHRMGSASTTPSMRRISWQSAKRSPSSTEPKQHQRPAIHRHRHACAFRARLRKRP